MRVLIAAAECSPLARTGGLGEAVAGLAGALRRRGIEVTVVIPRVVRTGQLPQGRRGERRRGDNGQPYVRP